MLLDAGATTFNVALPLRPLSVAEIVVMPVRWPVARPAESIVATVVVG